MDLPRSSRADHGDISAPTYSSAGPLRRRPEKRGSPCGRHTRVSALFESLERKKGTKAAELNREEINERVEDKMKTELFCPPCIIRTFVSSNIPDGVKITRSFNSKSGVNEDWTEIARHEDKNISRGAGTKRENKLASVISLRLDSFSSFPYSSFSLPLDFPLR